MKQKWRWFQIHSNSETSNTREKQQFQEMEAIHFQKINFFCFAFFFQKSKNSFPNFSINGYYSHKLFIPSLELATISYKRQARWLQGNEMEILHFHWTVLRGVHQQRASKRTTRIANHEDWEINELTSNKTQK